MLINRTGLLMGVRVWWLCVPCREVLEELTTDFSGMIAYGKGLVVEKHITAWANYTNAQPRVKCKAERERDTKVEYCNGDPNEYLVSEIFSMNVMIPVRVDINVNI